jgi:hypothetical protein
MEACRHHVVMGGILRLRLACPGDAFRRPRRLLQVE